MFEKAEQTYEIKRINIFDWLKYFIRLKRLCKEHREVYFIIFSKDCDGLVEVERKTIKRE